MMQLTKSSLKAVMPRRLRSERFKRLFLYGYAGVVTVVLLGVLTVMFTPVVDVLASNLLVKPDVVKADAIVVLAGGAYDDGTLGPTSLMRTLHGAELYREGLAAKVIFSGGNMLRHRISTTISEKMAALATRLGVPPRAQLIDGVSLRTRSNAVETKRIMDENGLKDVLLVTSATHMRRAMLTFEKLGIKVHPVPDPAYEVEVIDPFERFGMFKVVMREYVGILVYRWYGWI